ncbi:MAG TPA: hypothetical protein VFY66_03160 [Anaerolineales bacterium]|nr:hypothetical protein [Anaerolineales bacterium]
MFPPDERAGLFLDGQSLLQAGGEGHIPRAFALFFAFLPYLARSTGSAKIALASATACLKRRGWAHLPDLL